MPFNLTTIQANYRKLARRGIRPASGLYADNKQFPTQACPIAAYNMLEGREITADPPELCGRDNRMDSFLRGFDNRPKGDATPKWFRLGRMANRLYRLDLDRRDPLYGVPIIRLTVPVIRKLYRRHGMQSDPTVALAFQVGVCPDRSEYRDDYHWFETIGLDVEYGVGFMSSWAGDPVPSYRAGETTRWTIGYQDGRRAARIFKTTS